MNAEPYRVLLVDDDEDLSLGLSVWLGHQFQIEVTKSSERALERLKNKALPEVCCIVLDMHLPNGKGLELIRRFQRLHPDIPIVVVTGYPYSWEEVINAGAQDFFTKPFDSDALMRGIAHAIARHEVRSCFAPIDHEVERMKTDSETCVERVNQALRGEDSIYRIQRKPLTAGG